MGQKSSLPQRAIFVSQALMPDTGLSRFATPVGKSRQLPALPTVPIGLHEYVMRG
jgi:hypothetical protein